MLTPQPNWIVAFLWLLAATILCIMGIWFWDRAAETHWLVRSGLSVVVLLGMTAFSYGPITSQYALEHKASAVGPAPPI